MWDCEPATPAYGPVRSACSSLFPAGRAPIQIGPCD
jgi:hypothetical protein